MLSHLTYPISKCKRWVLFWIGSLGRVLVPEFMALVILWGDFSNTERTWTFVDSVLSQHRTGSNTSSDIFQCKARQVPKYLRLLVNLIFANSAPLDQFTREVRFVVVLIAIMYKIRLSPHHASMIRYTDMEPNMGLRLRRYSGMTHSYQTQVHRDSRPRSLFIQNFVHLYRMGWMPQFPSTTSKAAAYFGWSHIWIIKITRERSRLASTWLSLFPEIFPWLTNRSIYKETSPCGPLVLPSSRKQSDRPPTGPHVPKRSIAWQFTRGVLLSELTDCLGWFLWDWWIGD